MKKNNYREELVSSMQELSKNGYRCFIRKENPSYMYGFIITPNDNIIYIQRDSFDWMGWTFSLKYKPSQKNGSGCGCFENPVQEITLEIIQEAEKQGLMFARRLKATLYNNSEEYIKKLWNKEEYEEII